MPDAPVQARDPYFVHCDRVSFLKDCDLILAHLAQNAYGQARSRERVAPDDLLREAKLCAKFPHLVLKEFPEWLNELQVHDFRQSAHVVMAFDRCRRPAERG